MKFVRTQPRLIQYVTARFKCLRELPKRNTNSFQCHLKVFQPGYDFDGNINIQLQYLPIGLNNKGDKSCIPLKNERIYELICFPFVLACLGKNTFVVLRDMMICIKMVLNFLIDLPFICCLNASLFKLKTNQPTNESTK